MKRLRLERWPAQLLLARPGPATATAASSRSTSVVSCPVLPARGPASTGRHHQPVSSPLRRYQSTVASTPRDVDAHLTDPAGSTSSNSTPTAATIATTTSTPTPSSAQEQEATSSTSTTTTTTTTTSSTSDPTSQAWPTIDASRDPGPLPSPLPDRALRSAKLAALHARLALSDKIPLQTLARTLVDPSADPAPLFNNANLAFLGQTLISYHTSEMLMCRYPRLPMEIMHSAMKAFAGDRTLYAVARSWGVESAAAPGPEVDPGLLQFSFDAPRAFNTKWGFVRSETQYIRSEKYKRGISARVVLDDDFGELIPLSAAPFHNRFKGTKKGGPTANEKAAEDAVAAEDAAAAEEEEYSYDREVGLPEERKLSLGDPNDKIAKSHDIHATFVRAVVGAIYTHSGRASARSFVRAHVLSRQLDLARLFTFKLPVRELSRLCAREAFEPPVARLLSETGRLSRTPVFVVGIFSGGEKLGEGAAASLDYARKKAAMNALKAWYLYSPGEDVPVPSDTMAADGAKRWVPAYVDIGEVITPGL